MTDIYSWVKEIGRLLAAFVAILSVLWLIGKPHAQTLINDTVRAQGYASKFQMDEVSRKVQTNGNTARQVESRTVRIETRQETILQLLQEQRALNNEILRELRSRP